MQYILKIMINIFALFAFIIAIILIIHHTYIHKEYKSYDRIFQISDINNHETWIIACLSFAVGTFINCI